MERIKALNIANKLILKLAPHCQRAEIGGSLRRENSEVKDIEIICIPKKIKVPNGMFDTKEINDPGFVEIINSFEHIKGCAEEGKYCQRRLPEGIVLDLFIAEPYNWGYIFLIRTGPAKFSKNMMILMKRAGYMMQDGIVFNANKQAIPVKDEETMFKLARQQYVPPKFRVA
jgi:DNA polymerase/3'-5' exonuclease PolX